MPKPPKPPLPPLPPGSPGHYLLRMGWKRGRKGWTNAKLNEVEPLQMLQAVEIQQEIDNANLGS